MLHSFHRLLRALLGERCSGRFAECTASVCLPILGRPLRTPRETKPFKILLATIGAVQDVALFVFAGVGITVIQYYFNNGKFRFYPLAAMAVGFLIYSLTIGKLLLRLTDIFAFAICACFSIFFAIFITPVRIFVKFFGKIAKRICGNLGKSIAKKRRQVYNKYKKKRLLQQAEHGFFNSNE